MEENNNEKISVSGADLLKDVVADEKAAKTCLLYTSDAADE